VTKRPVDRNTASGAAPARREGGRTLKDVPVLVVEDDPSNAKLVAILLRAEGSDVHISRSAEDALAVIPIFKPRVIIMDLVLPKMSGVLLAKHLKNEAATRNIAIIAVTAFSGHDVERNALAAGCAAYVAKPIDAFGFPAAVLAQLPDA
jgi:CheY-like chemotaxis protein